MDILAMLSIFMVFLCNNSIINGLTPLYYGYCIFLLLYIMVVTAGENKRFNAYAIFLYISSILSILLFLPDPLFQSVSRFYIFVIVSFVFGPAISSPSLIIFRKKLFDYFGTSIVIVSILSFFLTITGIYKGGTNVGEDFMFSGLYQHSMTAGPIAAISLFITLHKFYSAKYFKQKVIHITIIAILFLSILMTGSRGALLALIVGLLTYFTLKYKFNFFRILKILSLITLILCVTFPLWKNKADFLITKFENNKEEGSQTSSRDGKWKQRIEEFYSSPIFGVGFAAIDPQGEDYFNRETGTVEPGSSWLGILSMTGILGFFSSISLYLILIWKTLKQYLVNRKKVSHILVVILSFFVVHEIFEGYFLAAGSLMFFSAWMYLGAAQAFLLTKSNNLR